MVGRSRLPAIYRRVDSDESGGLIFPDRSVNFPPGFGEPGRVLAPIRAIISLRQPSARTPPPTARHEPRATLARQAPLRLRLPRRQRHLPQQRPLAHLLLRPACRRRHPYPRPPSHHRHPHVRHPHVRRPRRPPHRLLERPHQLPLGTPHPLRRRATPFYAFFFFLLWTPPDNHETVRNAAYFFVILETFHLFSTLSGGPFESLLPEIAVTSRDRVGIVVWQVAFGAVGAGIGLVASGLIIDSLGYWQMGLIMGATALLSRYVALAGAWRHVRVEQPPVKIGLLQAFRTTFTNDQFLFFLPTFVLFNAGISMMTGSAPLLRRRRPSGRRGREDSVGPHRHRHRLSHDRPRPHVPACRAPGQGLGLLPGHAHRRPLPALALLHGVPARHRQTSSRHSSSSPSSASP